jgi:hypothetical protein
MKKVVLLLVLFVMCLTVPGCPGDAEHNARHIYIWERDVRLIHREWDAFWMEDQPSRLSPYRDF